MHEFSNRRPFGLAARSRRWLIAGLLLAVFVKLMAFDHALSLEFSRQSPQVEAVFTAVTQWGMSDWILYPSAALVAATALAARFGRPRLVRLAALEWLWATGFVFVGVGLPSLVANIVKRLVGRGRPEVFDTVGSLAFHPFAGNFLYESFPSGHTTTAFSLAMVAAFLWPRAIWLGVAYAVAIGASRLILGVHYPTDVFAGMLLGLFGAYAVRNYFASRHWGFERQIDGRIGRRPFVASRRLMAKRRRQPSAAT